VFASQHSFGLPTIAVATFFFAIQIYCDFSGYTDIARGLARMIGIELMENFSYPYFARNISDFWRCWHISLSTWLRDYLYIPLGGSRCKNMTIYRNLMITMVLGGLWHGANYNFLLWGTYHGLLLVLYRVIGMPLRSKWRMPAGMAMLVTFCFVLFGWFLFRMESLTDLVGLFMRIGGPERPELLPPAACILLSGGLLAWQWIENFVMHRRLFLSDVRSGFIRFVTAALLLVIYYLARPATDQAFIYFQF
jgi:alginate O-acetyltransferase complex protein AlgI